MVLPGAALGRPREAVAAHVGTEAAENTMAGCPTQDDLRRFLAGGMSEPEEEVLCTHVEGCPACQAALEALVKTTAAPRLAGLDPGGRLRGPRYPFLDKLKRTPPGNDPLSTS
jgi:hypothetical protein